jgi:hypothetical protein
MMKIIKLQPDQIPLFWDLIKHGVIQSYRIPEEFQQDFTIKYLENLLLGLYQCWLGYTGESEDKKIHAIMVTRIMDEKEYGIRTLSIVGIYGFRLIPQEMTEATMELVEEYARANDCNVIVTEYSLKRVGDMLESVGFEKHITVMRKILT